MSRSSKQELLSIVMNSRRTDGFLRCISGVCFMGQKGKLLYRFAQLSRYQRESCFRVILIIKSSKKCDDFEHLIKYQDL